MRILKFIYHFVINLVLYTVSVIPASIRDAWHEAFLKGRYDDRRFDRPVRFEGPESGQHKRRRRGHRGGKKHRKHFN